MRRPPWKVMAAIGAGMAVVPALALANQYELGKTTTALVAPACPPSLPSSQCTIILTRVTALETLRDGIAYPTKVKASGRIVAFTVGLSALSTSTKTRTSFIHYLDQAYGGTTQVAIAVLKPVGKHRNFEWQTVATSAMYHVEPYLGHVVQIPLDTAISVTPGEVVALTTPTWAPVLSINVDNKKFAYRQSRRANCNNPPGSTQAQTTGTTTVYKCDYPGTRLEYSATEISYPQGVAPSQQGTTTTLTTTATTTHSTSRTTTHSTSRTTTHSTSRTTTRHS